MNKINFNYIPYNYQVNYSMQNLHINQKINITQIILALWNIYINMVIY